MFSRRVVVASLVGTLLAAFARAEGPSRDLGSYTLFADQELRAKGLSVAGGNVGTNQGMLLSARALRAPDSEVAADTVLLARRSRCATLFSNRVMRTGPGCDPPTPFALPIFPDVAAACGFPHPLPACDPAAPVTVPRGGRIPLASGTYGQVAIGRGGRLVLGGGDYVFCQLRAARGARLLVSAPADVRLAGDLRLGGGTFTGSAKGAVDVQLLVAGAEVQVAGHSRLRGTLCAPRATLVLGEGVVLQGRAVARIIHSGRARVVPLPTSVSVSPTTTTTTTASPPTTSPLPASCGNGLRDAAEECDGGDLGGVICSGTPTARPACTSDCRLDYSPCPCVGLTADDTFHLVQDRIFTIRGCTLSTCHGSLAQANLVLLPGDAYGNLVDVLAANDVAHAAGKTRVAPGAPAASFLSQKLHGTLLAGEGSRMPLNGSYLSQLELDLIDWWIAAGAPATGKVTQAPCLPVDQYVPTSPPAPPPGGYQIVLEGPTLQPGEEQEGCMWIPVPNPSDFTVGKWEIALNPGTHHFAIVPWKRGGAPVTGVWTRNDFGCISGAQSAADFGNTITGSPQAPSFIDAYPPGVARVLPAGTYIGLNAHYHNYFDVPIEIQVWTNAWPYEGTPEHLAQTLVSLDTTFRISVPPFTVKVQPGHFVNNFGRPMSLFQVGGHMHKRGVRFTAWSSDGTKIYENFDWSHPLMKHLDPPLVLAPGDFVDYECLHDNGVNREVKRDAAGNPTTLTFGVTTDDEMCILTGQYYTD